VTWESLRANRFQLIVPSPARFLKDVLDDVNSTRTKALQRSLQERNVAFKGVQAVINYDVHATLQNRLRPEITYSDTVKLVAVESLDAIFFEQNVTINVCAVNERMGEEFAPPAQRCPRPAIYSHARSELWIVGAQTEFEDPQWLIAEFAEEHSVDSRVIVPTLTFVTFMLSHHTAHLSWRNHVDTTKLAYKFRCLTAGKTLNFWSASDEKGRD